MKKLLLALFLLSGTLCIGQAQRPVEYDKFEDFMPRLAEKDDTTYVVNFWATWCKPCVEELPYFEAFGEKYKNQKVKLLLVSLDFPNQIESRLIPFIEKKQLQSEVVVLKDTRQTTWIPKVSDEWSGAIPATLVYNAEERAFFEQNFHSVEELEAVVTPLIRGN